MRKSYINTEKRDERRKKILILGVGIFLIAIMALSSIAYIVVDSQTNDINAIKEFGFKFTPLNMQTQDGQIISYWQTTKDNKELKFTRLPSQVMHVDVTSAAAINIPALPQIKTAIISMNPTGDFIQQIFTESTLLFADLYDEQKQILAAFTNYTNVSTSQLPIISCQNQSIFEAQNLTGQIPIIQIEESNQTQITMMGNCLIVQGKDGEDIISAVEKLRYLMIGLDFTADPNQ